MFVGIIVYSKTGNTLSVANRLKQAFEKQGHTVTLEEIKAYVNEKNGQVTLLHKPDPTIYDRVVFASPVWAFTLCPVMKAYLGELSQLRDTSVYGIVTQQLSVAWLGGTRAVKKMRRLCAGVGAQIIGEGVIMWSHPEREKQITELSERLSSL